MDYQNKSSKTILSPINVRLAFITAILVAVVITPFLGFQTQSVKADANSDVQAFVGRHVGVYTSAPNPVNTGSTPGSKLGNGDVRVVIGGASSAQTLYVSKSDFWTASGGGYGYNPLNLGGITIRIAGLNGSSYRLEQDILRAEARGIFTINGQTVTQRSYVAATDNLIVTNLSLSGGNSMSVSVDTWTKLADGGRSALPTSTGIDNNAPVSTYATRETWPGAWTSRVAMATRVLGASSTFSSSGSNKTTTTFTLTSTQPLIIVTAVDGGKNVTNHLSTASSHVKAQTDTGLASLNTTHRNWWQSFWTKAYLDLGGDKVEQFWYAQQYALASTNRAGKLPPGLYGWLTTDNPNWNGDYHLNYNFQGPYYGVYASNHPELALPYFEPIIAFIPQGKTNATNLLGRPGVYYPVGLGPWGTTADSNFHQQKENAVFAALPFVDYYYATKDTAWLNTVYSTYLKEVANFWEADLVLNGNRWEIRNSAAREGNNPFGNLNAMPDLTLLKYFFKAMIVMSTDLNVDSGKRAQWQDYVNRLSALPTQIRNGKTVFKQAENMADSGFIPGDNPINFYAIFPASGNVGLSSSAATRQIAIDTITEQNSWNEGNSFILTYTASARAGWPAQDLYNRFMTRINSMGGDFLIYEGGGGLQTTGGTETVNSMLMQSHEDILRLFPSWPTSRNARFVNLRAKNAFLVSSQLTGGVVQYIDIKSEKGGSLTFSNPWGASPAITDTTSGGSVSFTTSGTSITFSTTTNHNYHIVTSGAIPPTATSLPGQGLANGKPTTADGACAANEASSFAVDGNYATKWCANGGGGNHWFQVDLGSSQSTTQFVIRHASSGGESADYNTRNFTIQTSPDDSTWTTRVTVTGNTAAQTTHNITAVSARYVKLNITIPTINDPSTAARIYEFQVFGGAPPTFVPPTNTPVGGQGIAFNKPTTADGSCAANEASSFAVDGNTTTKWCANGAAGNHWLQIDLGSSQSMTQFVIRHASSGGESADYNTRNFTIQTSPDGTTWTTRVTVTGNTAAQTTHNITAVSARYIKLNITVPSINDPNTAARIYEFQVF
jgi:alpha-L-fucosidase 2